MKGLKFAVGVAVFAASVAVEAGVVSLDLVGSQTAYSAVVPHLPSLTSQLDQYEPSVTGSLIYDLNDLRQTRLNIVKPYYNIEYSNGPGVNATVSFPHSANTFVSTTLLPWSYDPNTLTLSASGRSLFSNGSFCVGHLSICSAVYGQQSGVADIDIQIVFKDATASFFTGLLTFSQTLANGAVISGEYTFATPVPVPAAAWLFGAALTGLAGATRARRKGLAGG